MGEYILRLMLLLPMIGGLAWGSLWLWKKLQSGMPLGGPAQHRPANIVGVLPLGPGTKLAVVDFAGQQILIAVSRQGVTRIADNAQGEFHVD